MHRKISVIFSFLILLGIAIGVVCFLLRYRNVSFLVLFQNNYELRPTGGFLGSYGRLKFTNGQIDLSVQDIYVPDGQMDGHVDPPNAIQTAFGQGWYKLRDSNFDPDFPRSAKTMQWFFEKGKEKPVDGVIAINLEVFRAMIDVLGPIPLPDEKEPLTSESFYQLMQSEAEIGFFPGSQQKQVYLAKVGRATLEKLQTATLTQTIQLGQKLWMVARQKQLFVYANDVRLQKLISFLGFDGALKRQTGNYFSIVEANLGTNKANCCIQRQVELYIEPDNNQSHGVSKTLSHTATITFTNDNPATLKNPPYFWGGAYVQYLRVYVPIEATIHSVRVTNFNGRILDSDQDVKRTKAEEPLSIGDDHWEDRLATHSALRSYAIEKLDNQKLQSIGLFLVVDALKQESVEITYTLPENFWSPKALLVQKQGGVDVIPYSIVTHKDTYHFNVDKDTKVSRFSL